MQSATTPQPSISHLTNCLHPKKKAPICCIITVSQSIFVNVCFIFSPLLYQSNSKQDHAFL